VIYFVKDSEDEGNHKYHLRNVKLREW